MMTQKTDRREFLKRTIFTAGALTIVPRYVLGGPGFIAPSDKINIGYIGTGKQIRTLLNNFIKFPEVRVVAAADVDARKLARFRDWVEKYYTEQPPLKKYKGFDTYSD